jgi:hypothetical protein
MMMRRMMISNNNIVPTELLLPRSAMQQQQQQQQQGMRSFSMRNLTGSMRLEEQEFFRHQPDGLGFRPCIQFSKEFKQESAELIAQREKYLLVVVNGGLNQQRNQIVDAVIIARILGANLVVPIMEINQIWQDERCMAHPPRPLAPDTHDLMIPTFLFVCEEDQQLQIIRVETERIIASKDQQLLHSFCCKSISRDEWRLFGFLYLDRELIVMTLYQLLIWFLELFVFGCEAI